MRNPDADFRFMALNDLINECTRSSDGFSVDEPTEKQTVDLVLELVNDKNTEVKNQAVKTCVRCQVTRERRGSWLAPQVGRAGQESRRPSHDYHRRQARGVRWK